MTHDMVKRTFLLFLSLSIVMRAGYAAAEDADVHGTWVGSTQTGAVTMTLVLQQTGRSVTGNIVGYGTDDGPLNGTVNGNTIRLRFDNGTDWWPLLNVKGNEITGLFNDTTITLRRTAP